MITFPLVSVIIPVYNGEKYLAEAIQSVLAQDYTPLEIIVVDGHSTDATAAITQSFESVRYILQRDPAGIASARNQGIDRARGEFIAFNSHDDVWTPDKLRLQAQVLMDNSQIQFVNCHVKIFLDEQVTLPPGARPEWFADDYPGWMPETLLARKSLFETAGIFRADLQFADDMEWFARVRENQTPAQMIRNALVHRRIHSANTTLTVSPEIHDREFLQIMKEGIARKRARQ